MRYAVAGGGKSQLTPKLRKGVNLLYVSRYFFSLASLPANLTLLGPFLPLLGIGLPNSYTILLYNYFQM